MPPVALAGAKPGPPLKGLGRRSDCAFPIPEGMGFHLRSMRPLCIISGHGFSRAETAPINSWALAPAAFGEPSRQTNKDIPQPRRSAVPRLLSKRSTARLQQRLVKTGGRLVKHTRCHWLFLAESHLTRRLFGSMLRRTAALPLPTG